MSKSRRDLHGLWEAVFGEPPSIDAEPGLLARLIVQHLPAAPPYGQPAPPRDAKEALGDDTDGEA